MSTRFGSWSSVTHEVRACSEYWIDRPKNWRTVLALRQTVSRGFAPRGHGVEYRAVADLVPGHHGRQRGPGRVRGDRVDLGHHGLVAWGEFVPLELGVGVLVGHRGVAEGRAVVADVVPVVELVEVVEPRAGRPDGVVLGAVAHGAPAGLVEGVAEGEPAAGDQLGIPQFGVDPQPRLQGGVGELADPAEARGGDPGAPRGPAGAGQ